MKASIMKRASDGPKAAYEPPLLDASFSHRNAVVGVGASRGATERIVSIRPALTRPLISVKPIQYVPDALSARKCHMPCFIQDMALVFGRSAEEVKKGLLARFDRIIIIGFSIEHESRYFYMRQW